MVGCWPGLIGHGWDVADPTGSPIANQFTSFRTTTRTTELVQRGSRWHVAAFRAGLNATPPLQLNRIDASVTYAAVAPGNDDPDSSAPDNPFRLPRRTHRRYSGITACQPQGLKTRMPVSAKSLMLRVPRARSYCRQIAAI